MSCGLAVAVGLLLAVAVSLCSWFLGEIMAGAERRAEEKGEMRTLQSRTPVDESWPTPP